MHSVEQWTSRVGLANGGLPSVAVRYDGNTGRSEILAVSEFGGVKECGLKRVDCISQSNLVNCEIFTFDWHLWDNVIKVGPKDWSQCLFVRPYVRPLTFSKNAFSKSTMQLRSKCGRMIKTGRTSWRVVPSGFLPSKGFKWSSCSEFGYFFKKLLLKPTARFERNSLKAFGTDLYIMLAPIKLGL